MRTALTDAWLVAETQVPTKVSWLDSVTVTLQADMVVNGYGLVELKQCEVLVDRYEAQILHDLRAICLEAALPMNFSPPAQLKRVAIDNESNKSSVGRRQAFRRRRLGWE
jgi:GxxExxY protein